MAAAEQREASVDPGGGPKKAAARPPGAGTGLAPETAPGTAPGPGPEWEGGPGAAPEAGTGPGRETEPAGLAPEPGSGTGAGLEPETAPVSGPSPLPASGSGLGPALGPVRDLFLEPDYGERGSGLHREHAVLHELVKAARARLKPGTWDYLVGGSETETTFRRNRLALDEIAFRPRVLRDVSRVDPSGRLLGIPLRIPVVLAPIGSLQDFDPGGGATTARAAIDYGVVSMLSSACEPGLEEVARAAPDGPKIFQLYVRGDADWVDDHARRAVACGYDAFALTVDLDYYGRRERDLAKRFKTTARQRAVGPEFQMRFSWDDVKRLKDRFDLPIVLKGIATAEDTEIACEHGVEAVYVSNHGGRQLDHGRGAIEVLPEVVRAAAGRAEVMVDGGFLRGADVVKAMILGADAVGVGRLTGFAVAAAGRAGVVRMLELLEHEIRICLGLLGVNGYGELDETWLHRGARAVAGPHATSAFPLLAEGY